MGRKSRPKLFKSNAATKKSMENLGENLINSTLNSGMKAIQQSKPKDIKAVRKPKYLEVTEKRMKKMGVVDLKTFFATSPSRKPMKGGGWYLKIPIQRKARQMTRRMYDQLRSFTVEPGESKTVISDYLYDRRRNSDASLLNYEPKSHNITKISSGKNRNTYIAFRTVSDKSPVNSWILNRAKVNSKDTSKTFIKNVNRVMKFRMKNL